MDDDYEHILLIKPDVFVYKIPPRTSISRAHRAADWTLDKPDWKGRLRLILKGTKCKLKLEDKENGKLFAECFVEKFPGNDVESVSDSSRYFVIKIKDTNSGRTAFIGIGFEDRGDSFDLNVALQDHFKRVEQEEAISQSKDDDTPKIDLSLKEGQTIKVNLNISKKSGASRPKAKADLGGSIGLLPPPPGNLQSHKDNSSKIKKINCPSDDILLFDDLSNETTSKGTFNDDSLAEFDGLKVANAKPPNNDDWSNFESFKPSNNQDNPDQTSNWATF